MDLGAPAASCGCLCGSGAGRGLGAIGVRGWLRGVTALRLRLLVCFLLGCHGGGGGVEAMEGSYQ